MAVKSFIGLAPVVLTHFSIDKMLPETQQLIGKDTVMLCYCDKKFTLAGVLNPDLLVYFLSLYR
jgi:hypothetical protein